MLTLRIKNQGLEDVEILKDNYFFLKDKNNITIILLLFTKYSAT